MKVLNVFFFCVSIVYALPQMPNIEYLGAGYDVLRGNPRSTESDAGVDPGFQQLIFDLTIFNNSATPDNKYIIPFGTDVLVCDSCSMESDSYSFSGGMSYSETLGGGVSGKIGIFGISFGASEDWKKVYTQSTSYKDVFMETSATCCAYTASLSAYDLPPLTTNFINGVTQLPEAYNETEYMAFITAFGTHYVTDMIMGGVYGMRSTFSSVQWSQMSGSSMDTSMSAGFSLFSFTAAASTMSSSDKTMASNFQRFVSASNLFFIGGQLTANGTVDAWSASVIADPMPINITVEVITNLLTPAFFPDMNATELANKQSALANALDNYCNYLVEQGEMIVCNPGPDPAYPPHSNFGGIFQNDDCGMDNTPNPYTGVLACPAWCTEYQVARVTAGTSKCGATVFICLQSNSTDFDPTYNYGGQCQLSGNGIDNRVNPVTNAENCPADYSPIPIGSTVLPDDRTAPIGILYGCENTSVVPTWQSVGGYYQFDPLGINNVVNLYTQAYSCPVGYSDTLYGLAMVDAKTSLAAAQYICINQNLLGLYSATRDDKTNYIDDEFVREYMRKQMVAAGLDPEKDGLGYF